MVLPPRGFSLVIFVWMLKQIHRLIKGPRPLSPKSLKSFFEISASPIRDYWNMLSGIQEIHIRQKKDNKPIKVTLPPERIIWYIEMYNRGVKIEEIDPEGGLITWRYQNILLTARWEQPEDNATIKQVYGDKLLGERFENMRIIDIGGYIGDTALMFIHGGARQVCVVEPSPENLKFLKKNIEQNFCTDRVRIFPVAIGAQDGIAQFTVDENHPDSHHLSVLGESIMPLQKNWRNLRTVEVPLWTFEKLLKELGWEEVDFVKVDCEGGEYPLFMQTPPEVLRRVKTYYVEYHDGIEPLERRLDEVGYSLQKLPNPYTPFPQMGFFYAHRKN